MADILNGNRAKLNFLMIKWEEQRLILSFNYHKKNKKKEHSKIIELLEKIPEKPREKLLKQYIAHCRMAAAFAFFQWRYMILKDTDPVKAELNKDIFYQRI